ncbi:hypothetical protein SteCoe_20696 [Stentor coeruleus]|uniref:Uncharacterized protein n=1 Tax=Stentor coeruleus TaxID=5963 RepID=A0A1R2BRW0_9CILI|nr:hypothetical protein SteCoe_20696 [Stentor coeruleus]
MEDDFDAEAVSRGKLSLAEAFKEIQTVKRAFQKAERIEQKLHFHDSVLAEIKNTLNNLATFEYINFKIEETNAKMDRLIRQKFEEFTSQYMYQVNDKVSLKDMETSLSQRVTWMAFNNFTQQMNLVKTRIEKHIVSDFEGFKTKMKIELSKKANEKRPEDELTADEIQQIKNRITSLEQKYQDMFAEEGLDESDDYDSQEEMDNMMDDIDRAAMRDHADSDEQMNEGDQEADDFPPPQTKAEIPGTPTTQNSEQGKNTNTPFTSPTNPTPEVANAPSVDPPKVEESKTEKIPEEVKKESINLQKDPIPEPKQEIITSSQPPPNPPIVSPQVPQSIITAPVVQETKPLPVEQPVEIKKEIPLEKPQEPKPKLEIIPNKEIVPEEVKSPTKIPQRTTIEVDNSGVDAAKYARTKGGSSRNDGQTLSRKNSMVSSRSGTGAGAAGPGGMRQINKKLTSLQKELDGYKLALDESKQTLLDYQAELAQAYEKIASVRNECQEVENRRQGMEISFIKALRRNGVERKKATKNVAIANINAKQMGDIKRQIEEKGKKILTMTTYVEKMAADTQVMKDTQKSKINEVIQYVKYLDDAKTSLTKEFSSIVSTVKQIEANLKINIANVEKDVATIQGPIVDLISEQQRENQILNENIKTQTNLINEMIDAKPIRTPLRGRITQGRSVPGTASPDLSLKYKLTSSKNGNRRISANTSNNWLEGIPDGTPLVLPRINAGSPPTNKKRSL